MNKWIIKYAPWPLAAFFGCILTLAFAPYNIFPLAILAPAGLLMLWLNVSPWQAFWRGFWFGAFHFATGIYWVYHSIHNIGGIPTPLALLIAALFISILSLFPAVTGYIYARFFPHKSNLNFVLTFPALWVWGDLLRTYLFTGFPWLLIGYTQINSPLRGYASLLSVYGVTLITLMTSGLAVSAWFNYKSKNFRTLYFSFLAITTLWIGGAILNTIHWTTPVGKTKSVALVQGDIPQTLKWSPDHLQLSLVRYAQLTKPLFGKTDIIIWPEAAVPVPLNYAQDYINALNQKAKQSGSELILGIPIRDIMKGGYYNSVITLGTTNQVYNKRHLVPFGEYTPEIPLLNKTMALMDIPLSDSINGAIQQPLLVVDNMKILTTVCYEIAYPELMRSDVLNDASLSFILTVTNDGWFGKSNAQAQHLQMAQMRALEFGRQVLFVSNDGITAIIDANGNIEAQAPPYQQYVLKGEVQAMSGVTPWMMTYGSSSFKYLILLFLAYSIKENIDRRRAMRKKTVLENNLRTSV